MTDQYESAYTGAQIDEAIQKAQTIPSSGIPTIKQYPIGNIMQLENSVQLQMSVDIWEMQDILSGGGFFYGYNADYGFLFHIFLGPTWMGLIGLDPEHENTLLYHYEDISSYPTIVTFTPKKIALPSEAFGTLAFKSLVEKTDLSTEVLTLLNKQPKQYTGTLLATGWAADANGYQAQTISISGLKASYDVDPQWDVVLSGTDPDADAALLEGFALIHNYKTGVNSLTAQCIGSTPTINIPVKVVIFG